MHNFRKHICRIICLVMAMAFSCAIVPQADLTAFAAGNSVTVANSAQLKAALADQNVSEIIIDETGILSAVTHTDLGGNKGTPTFEGSDVFYLPVDEPLTVNRAVTIKSSNNKEVRIARSSNFAATNEKPAIFNVTGTGNLTLSGNVTMTGEQVTVEFDEGQAQTVGQPRKVHLSAGEKKLGTISDLNLKLASNATSLPFWLDNNGYLHSKKDGTEYYIRSWNGNYNLLAYSEGYPHLKICDTNGGTVKNLAPNGQYVLFFERNGTTYYLVSDNSINGGFNKTTTIAEATIVTASSISGETQTGTAQEYIPPHFNFTINKKDGSSNNETVWTKNEIKEGGYFIHSNGGKVALGSGVTLQGLITANDAKNAAPVYIGGNGGQPAANSADHFTMNGAVIKNNRVGYVPTDAQEAEWSSWMVKKYGTNLDIEGVVEGNAMTNTAGGIIFAGGAKATITSGEISKNRADVGAILIKDNSYVVMNGNESTTKIINNVGFHHAGAAQVEDGGTLLMNGGTMSDNVAWYKGGAVWATEWGTNGYADLDWNTHPFPTLRNEAKRTPGGNFVMNGGSLKNNIAFKRAGAIEVESNGVTLVKGEISGNITRSLGGAIYVEGDNTTYTYTLAIENGYIVNNTAATASRSSAYNGIIEVYLDGNGNIDRTKTKESHDHDFSMWSAAGNGGGVWLCPRGGTASFTGQNVIIDNNKKERSGTDLFLQPGYGSVMLQQMAGTWKNESTKQTVSTDGVYNGPLPLINGSAGADFNVPANASTTGILIKDNYARDGGGIAANGTVLFGTPKDIYRYDARVDVVKTWDNVPASEREPISIKVGYMNASGQFVALDTALLKDDGNGSGTDSQDIVITLDGQNGQNGDFSDSILAETTSNKNADTWTGYVTVPAAINGEALYKFETPAISQLNNIPSGSFTANEVAAYNELTELDPSKSSHLKYIYYIAKYYPALLKVKAGTSKIVIRETNTKYEATYNLNLQVDQSKINITSVPTQLIEPASGTVHKTFNTHFTSITAGVGLTNKLRETSVEFTKVAADSNTQQKWIKGAKFIVAEISLDGSGDFRVVGQPGEWNPTPDSNKNKTILDVAEKDASGNMAVYTSGNDGKTTITKLRPGKRYLMFELEPQAGFETVGSPWILDAAADGTVSILAIDPDAQFNNQSAIGKVKRKRNGVDRLQDFIVNDQSNASPQDKGNSVYRTYWPSGWFYERNGDNLGSPKNPVTDKRVKNNTAQLKITKVDESDETQKLAGAKFVFADVGWNNTQKTEIYAADAGIIRNSAGQPVIVTSGSDGSIDLASVINELRPEGNIGKVGQARALYDGKIALLMFEVKPANVHQLKTVPWLVLIDREGKVEVREHENPYLFNRSPISEDGNWQYGNTRMTEAISKFSKISEGTVAQNAKVSNKPVDFELTKIDADSTEDNIITLKGAEFKLYKATASNHAADGRPYGHFTITDKNPIVADKTTGSTTFKSSENGKIKLPIPDAGEYIMYETKAPVGYKKAVAPWGIWVKEDNTVVAYRIKTKHLDDVEGWLLNPQNDPTKVQLNCEHFEWIGEYVKNEKEHIELYKVDETDDTQKLGGAKFVLCEAVLGGQNCYSVKNAKTSSGGWDDDATVWSTAIKGSNGQPRVFTSEAETGKIVIDNIEDGTYLLFETEAPKGFVRTTSPWVIKVQTTETSRNVTVKKIKDGYRNKAYKEGSKPITIDPATPADQQTVARRWWQDGADSSDSWFETMSADEPYNLVNEPKYLTKVDLAEVGDTDGVTGLPKAEFELYKTYKGTGTSTGTVFYRKTDKVGNKQVSDSEGKIKLPGSVTTTEGKYLLFETAAPNGYKRTYTPWLLTVDASGNIQVQRFNGEALKYNHVNTVYGYETFDGYQWWRKSNFLTEGWNDKYRVPNVPNDVSLTKVDGYDTSNKLQGAQFELFSYDRTESDKYYYRVKDSVGLTSISDASGRFTLPVTSGKYLMFERTSPNGYKLEDKPWWIEITRSTDWHGITTTKVRVVPANGSTPSSGSWNEVWWTFCENQEYDIVKNYPVVSLTKVDIAGVTKSIVNGKEVITLGEQVDRLSGVKFMLYKATVSGGSDNTSNTWKKDDTHPGTEFTTNANGVLELGALENGKYLLEETAAKDNTYMKPKNPWRLVVNNGKATVYAPIDPLGTTTYREVNPNSTDGVVYITNSKVAVLPNAGGIGAHWFSLIGALMMAFAVMMLLSGSQRRREQL